MIAVEHHLAVRDVGHRVETGFLFDFHADGDALAVPLRRLHAHQLRVVLAEGLLGLELQLDRFARRLAFQRALERFEQLAVPAVQIGEVRSGLELDILGVVQLYAQGDDGIPRYERSRLTRSNTSAAWPRGFTP